MARAKSRIAAKLSELVPSTGAIAFDASSTIMRLAADLANDRSAARDLTGITNSPDMFAALQVNRASPRCSWAAVSTRAQAASSGRSACRAAAQLAVQCFFASAAALDPRSGALEATPEEAEVKRSIAAVSDRVVLAVDSSKLDTRAVAVDLCWERIDVPRLFMAVAERELAMREGPGDGDGTPGCRALGAASMEARGAATMSRRCRIVQW